jgi:transposase
MPSSHRRYGDWTPARIREEATRIGPMMSLLVEKIIENRPHPEQGYRSCLGIIGLEKRFGAARLEAAALRALEVQARNYPPSNRSSRRARSRARADIPGTRSPSSTQHPGLRLLPLKG